MYRLLLEIRSNHNCWWRDPQGPFRSYSPQHNHCKSRRIFWSICQSESQYEGFDCSWWVESGAIPYEIWLRLPRWSRGGERLWNCNLMGLRSKDTLGAKWFSMNKYHVVAKVTIIPASERTRAVSPMATIWFFFILYMFEVPIFHNSSMWFEPLS